MKITPRMARISSGYTLKDVARNCNVSASTVLKYERKVEKTPLYLIILEAKLYGVSPNIFMNPTSK